ncbi:MAG: AMP-binding protein [Pirellulales bacterium]|nr:AMP-binding protein [Pirellulales bacterium]
MSVAAETEPPAALPHVNVADRLTRIAALLPEGVAVACPGRGDVAGRREYATCTFRELDADATALARGLVDMGVTPGMRLVLLVRPGIEFVKLVFSLLRSGATMVLIDPGMGRNHLLECLAATEPQGFVAISPAQAVRRVYARRFPRARLNVTVGRRWFWGGATYRGLLAAGRRSRAALPRTATDDCAAIIFTSGSTGPPKGVLSTHGMFEAQVRDIAARYALTPGGADLACFPLFGLFNSAMGVTTVFPRMDFSRPATAECGELLAAASDWRVTQAFASPAVWDKLSRHCEATGERMPTLRKVFSCGAPVPAAVLRRTLGCVAEDAEMHTPYGATEALPVATIAASEVLGETAERTDQGRGVCVGRRFDSIAWKVVRIADEPLATLAETDELPAGEIGELVVRGEQVSPAYVVAPGRSVDEANATAKIRTGAAVWHRLGDVGYFDDEERFWYCGRKTHRVETAAGTLFTECVEGVFNVHPHVRRTALVGIGPRGAQTPVLCVEPTAPFLAEHGTRYHAEPYRRLADELRAVGRTEPALAAIETILFRDRFPVDVRHNAKIRREELATWAENCAAGRDAAARAGIMVSSRI